MVNTDIDNKIIIQSWNDKAFSAAGIHTDVLRLDLLHPTVSGNKWLKLNGYLQKAIKEKKAGILTKGGPWSNHVHACAYACQLLDLSCHLWIKGNEKQPTTTIKDCMDWGAAIRFVNRSVFYDEQAAQVFADENNLQYVPLGGSDHTGIQSVTGYIEALALPSYTHAVCSVGTATTFAGFAFQQNNFMTVTGIESGTKDGQLVEKIAAWQTQFPHKKLELLFQFSFGGYSKYNEELTAFMNELYLQHEFPTDIVYTAKLFHAVKQLAAQQHFAQGSRLLIIHSGGLQGNRSLPPALLQF